MHDPTVVSAFIRDNRELTARLVFTSAAAGPTTCDLTYEYVKLNAEYTT